MPTVTKTFTFASGTEGLLDLGISGVTFAHVAGDGNPSGSIQFTQATKLVTQSEIGARNTTGETWETWGVPAGSTVTSVQITAWQERLAANTKLSSHSVQMQVMGSDSASALAGDLINTSLGTTTDATWQAGAAGSSQAVNTNRQASTTDVRLYITYSVTTSGGGGSANVDQRFDQIELTITYTAAGPSAVGKELQSVWNTRAAVSDTLDLPWGVRTSVPDVLEAQWAVRAALGDELQALWNVRAAVSDALNTPWSVRAAVFDTLDTPWSVRTTVSDILELPWSTRAAAGDNLGLVWSVIGPVGKDLEARWNVRAVAGDDLQALWNVRATLGDDIGIVWAVRSTTGEPIALVWHVQQNGDGGPSSSGQTHILPWP